MKENQSLVKSKVIRLPKDDVEWFETTYPAYGSWTWFIRTALHMFRLEHEEVPDDIIKRAIQATVEESNATRNYTSDNKTGSL